MTAPVIHIHEDDWGMRNLYPVTAFAHVSDDVRRAAEAGEENRAPGGMGWTRVYLIEAPTTSYFDLDLPLKDASQALGAIMPRVRKFNATAMAGFDPNVRDVWGSYDDDAYCYGFDRECFIKLEPEGKLVKAIWFEAFTDNLRKLAALRSAMLAIEALARSVIADYRLNEAGALADDQFLDRYFGKLAEAAR